ncbi:hypothetical protein Ddc_01554 [Ditylenchus destructor]|nr:hypothetical protein Ddc_01554 [Ditylenchus destructor]
MGLIFRTERFSSMLNPNLMSDLGYIPRESPWSNQRQLQGLPNHVVGVARGCGDHTGMTMLIITIMTITGMTVVVAFVAETFPSQKLSRSVQVQSPPEVSTVNAEDRRKTFYGDQKLRDAGLSILDWANPDLHRRNLDMRIDSTAPMPEAESSGNRVGKQKMAKSHKRKHHQTDKNGRIRSGKSKKMTTPKIKATPKARNQMCYFTALPCII